MYLYFVFFWPRTIFWSEMLFYLDISAGTTAEEQTTVHLLNNIKL